MNNTYKNIAQAVLAILLSFLVSSLFLLIMDNSPIEAFSAIFYGSFGSLISVAETMSSFSTYLFLALATTVAFRAYIFNIGMEGQLYLGAVFSTWFILSFSDLPAVIMIPFALLAGFFGGALWAFLPALLKAKLKVDEILTTLFMNYIAYELTSFLVTGPLQEPPRALGEGHYIYPRSPYIPEAAQYPFFFGVRQMHIGIIIAILVALVFIYIFRNSVFGYNIKMLGSNREAAIHGGINVEKLTIKVMLLSGGIAGLAGANIVMGVHHRLHAVMSHDYGYIAIAIAVIGGLSPLGSMVASYFFAILDVGGGAMQYRAGVTSRFIFLVQGLIIIFYMMRVFFTKQAFDNAKGILLRRLRFEKTNADDTGEGAK